MSRIPTLADLGDVGGKRVLVRTDFNVPMENGVITDDFRIRAALPTIEWLTTRGADVVCASESGGVGRRTGLRIQPWRQGGGSNPPSRTNSGVTRTRL